MDKEITTTIKNQKKGDDSAGELELTTGYTITRSSKETNEIDTSHQDCYAKKSTFKTGENINRYKYCSLKRSVALVPVG